MFNYNSNNIFAKIIRQEILVKKVYEDNIILAFYDIKPEAPIHILAITKQAYCNYTHFISHFISIKYMVFLFYFSFSSTICPIINSTIVGTYFLILIYYPICNKFKCFIFQIRPPICVCFV